MGKHEKRRSTRCGFCEKNFQGHVHYHYGYGRVCRSCFRRVGSMVMGTIGLAPLSLGGQGRY